ncbi:SHOCT domain-containing protein [Kribbella pratensis]|uniref:Oligomerization/nucleic acid binding protein n=1 Tax=Kribbella pratensis TaxID=2512112 RepID=A0A4R8CMD0_9ACTN|nr:SHOCT domain-containing protein [Kribbella pratensis]TDW77230.1 putative oligomerization/nucleic acid binding protein [Kribbella pratensis]
MPLLRGLARTAAVAGTATAVAGRVRRRQDAKFARQDAEAAPAAAPAEAPEPAPAYAAPEPPPDNTADRLDQLKSLGELKQSGVLTEAEFEAQKAKILAG